MFPPPQKKFVKHVILKEKTKVYAFCPYCKQKYEIEREQIGLSIKCTCWHDTFTIQNIQENDKLMSSPQSNEDIKMKEYKVLAQKDKWFSQKFEPETLEKALNS